MPSDKPVLAMTSVSVSIGGQPVVRNVSLRLWPGHVYALVGHNGSGKTTLMRAALGLIRPLAGEIRLLGARPPAGPGAVGASFGPRLVHPRRRVATELHLLVSSVGGDPKVAMRLCEDARLPVARLRCGDLSTGQAQKLAFACAMAASPRLLVLDEPTSGLDAAALPWLRGQLAEYVAAGGCVWLSSHDTHEVEQAAAHITVLRDGRVAYSGPAEGIIGQAAIRVRSCDGRMLTAALREGGLRHQVQADGEVLVEGASAEEVGRLLAAHRVPVTFMTGQEQHLDQAIRGLLALEAAGA